jgi:hypothetical protein
MRYEDEEDDYYEDKLQEKEDEDFNKGRIKDEDLK